MRPSWLPVRALKPLQNSMMLTPCCPSAGPTGGAGLAFPAGIWSFTTAWTFFAMVRLPLAALPALHLVVLELHRREPPEDLNHDLQLAALGAHVLDHPAEVDERALDHAHLVPLLEDRLGLRLLGAELHLVQDRVDLVAGQRRGPRPRPDEPGHLRRRLDEVPGIVRHLHLNEHVAGEELL